MCANLVGSSHPYFFTYMYYFPRTAQVCFGLSTYIRPAVREVVLTVGIMTTAMIVVWLKWTDLRDSIHEKDSAGVGILDAQKV